MPRILVADDDQNIRRSLALILEAEGYAVDQAHAGEEALELLDKEMYDVMLCDLFMNDMDGIAVLRRARQLSPETQVVMITGFASVDTAVEAMKAGAHDYVSKPIQLDALKTTITKCLERTRTQPHMRELERQLLANYGFSDIIAASSVMQDVLRRVVAIAATDATVLITGESGTGKDLVACAIHKLSTLIENPLLTINCSAMPENLLESELFGHAKGAFTGAIATKIGLVEEADGGTLFLDEIGDAPLPIQSKLLRFIEKGEFRRVGENATRNVKVRLLAATNRDLGAMIEARTFREDLYYRLNVIPLHLPPLRERKEDIMLLAQHMLRRLSRRPGGRTFTLDSETMAILLQYPWPGNIRELRHAMEYSATLCQDSNITPEDLPPTLTENARRFALDGTYNQDTLDEMEKLYILKVLNQSDWNQKRACKVLGMSKTTLYRRLKGYGIQAKVMGAVAGDFSLRISD